MDSKYMSRIHVLILVFIISFIGLTARGSLAKDAAGTAKSAPTFTLTDIKSKKVSLSDFKGKVVLLNFWATWCVPCREEMPPLNKLYTDLKNEGFVVLGVSIDPSETPVKSFVTEKNIMYPVLMDSEKEVYFDLYAVLVLPTSFLIDKDGMIVEKILGERDWNSPEMKDKIMKLLKRR